MIKRLRQRFQSQSTEGSFIKNSAIVAVGFTLARALGIGFSFALAGAIHPDVYGYIQYSISLALIVGIVTMPVAQHLLARQISVHAEDQQKSEEIASNFYVMMVGLFILTLLVVVPIFILTGTFNLGALLIFFGVTVFYSYYGMARGFVFSVRLAMVFVASNAIQLILILFIYHVLKLQSGLPALAVYGLSYLAPVGVLLAFYPFPVGFRRRHVSWPRMKEMLRASIPLWISQAGYAFSTFIDFFLLQQLLNNAAVGLYAFTRQVCIIFDFLPMGLYTVLMPKVAAADNRRTRMRLIALALGITVVANAVVLVVFLLVYPWFIDTFYPQYELANDIVLVMALAQTAWGLQGIISQAVIGANRASVDSVNRLIPIVLMPVIGLILIPMLGVRGAALMSLITGCAAVIAFPVQLWLSKRIKFPRRKSEIQKQTVFGTE
ncbi:MAG: oligosaccharide flippase family protein [Anaerolineae bacterium]|nr:oligosaccharide flippase family protein [Anaerolineae bacterium]